MNNSQLKQKKKKKAKPKYLFQIDSINSRKEYQSYIHSDASKNLRRLILNQWESDIGYPQEILIDKQKSHTNKNYMAQNVRKISQYGPQFVKVHKHSLSELRQQLQAGKILQCKKQQSDLKDITKINLKKQLSIPNNKNEIVHIQKLEYLFKQQLKNEEYNLIKNLYPERFGKYSQTFVLKRSLTKKKMPNENFDNEVSGNSQKNTLNIPRLQTKPSQIMEKYDKQKEYKESLVKYSRRKKKSFNLPRFHMKNSIVNDNQQSKKTQQLQSLERIDPIYYDQLKKYRTRKLTVMQYEIDNQNKLNTLSQRTETNLDNKAKSLTKRLLNKISESNRFIKIKSILDHLSIITFNAWRFGISEKYIYSAIIKNHPVNEFPQSQKLFHSIIKNDLDMIEFLIQQNRELLYAIDEKHRTPLLLSVQSNNQKLVEYMLKKGSNLHKKNKQGYSVLYYAIKNQNYKIFEMLLQNGAEPWSDQHNKYNYKSLSGKWYILLRNAKKIWISLKLCPKKRTQIWQNFKQKLSGQEFLVF